MEFDLGIHMTPKAFHRYPSVVMNRILNESDSTDRVDMMYALIAMFKSEGIHAQPDNKIVFEFDLNGESVYFGFYDFTFSIGLDMRHLD